jgi:hypothetical protein
LIALTASSATSGAILPFLLRDGKAFGYDFVVRRTRASETDLAIHRVVTLCFPGRERASALFSDPAISRSGAPGSSRRSRRSRRSPRSMSQSRNAAPPPDADPLARGLPRA